MFENEHTVQLEQKSKVFFDVIESTKGKRRAILTAVIETHRDDIENNRFAAK